MDMMPMRPQSLNTYLDHRFSCSCGREHYAPLKVVSIGKDALCDIPRIVGQLGFKNLYLISDSITYQIAGSRCMEILQEAGINASIIQLKHTGFDEATLGEILINMPPECDVVVAVGTGAINDMCRYFSFRMGRPFFTVATAAPMDGFASSLAVLNINHLKTSIEAQTPSAIIGDTEILKNAPYRMIAAGLGDLLGKLTCICDWKLARLIIDEHFCPQVAGLVSKCAHDVLGEASKAKDRDPVVLGNIMEGLVLTGVAMSLYGNSRPASGCEHHLSHYWEMVFEQRGEKPFPHGTQVGVGTVLILKLVEALKRRTVDFDAAKKAALSYDQAAWEEAVNKVYGPAAPGIIEMEARAKKNETAGRLKRIDTMMKKWDGIDELIGDLPESEDIVILLKSLGSPSFPSEIGVDKETLRNTLLYAKEVRPRYTILQMLWDLGLLEELADEVIAELEEV